MKPGRRFLFERLAGIEADDFDVRAAASAQVRRLVGTVPIDDPDEALAEGPHLLNFGLPPIVDLGFATPNERQLYADHLRNLLAAFEPRLSDARVSFTGAASGPQPIGIDIQARLEPGEEDEIIRFHVGASGLES